MQSFFRVVSFFIFLMIPSLSFSASNVDIKNATVRISVTSAVHNYLYPWQTKIDKSSGTGFIISKMNGEKIILTNAHVVAGARHIEVKKYGSAKTCLAEVIAISHHSDLALVQTNESLYDNITPIEFSNLPATQEDVFVYGYPTGSDALSVTKGVFSRLLSLKYANSYFKMLAGQVDAALNHGNSGGPVIYNNKAIGVAMQIDRNGDNEGYGFLIPSALIKQFLKDFDDGHIDGIPTLEPIFLARMENSAKRAYFKMRDDQTGCLVVKVSPNTVVAGKLKKHDIILSIDGYNVFNDGTIEIRPNEHVVLHRLATLSQIGDEIVVKVLRDGNVIDISLVYDKVLGENTLVKGMPNKKPEYFVFSGMVFTPLTLEYLSNFQNNWKADLPNYLKDQIEKTSPFVGKERVLMSLTLDNKTLKGYNHNNEILVSVNDIEIKNIKHLVEVIENSKAKFLVFKFFTREDDAVTLTIIDRKEAISINNNIFQKYEIPVDRYLE